MRPSKACAIWLQFWGPYFMTLSIRMRSSSSVQGPLTISGLSTFCHLCKHCTSDLWPRRSAILFQLLACTNKFKSLERYFVYLLPSGSQALEVTDPIICTNKLAKTLCSNHKIDKSPQVTIFKPIKPAQIPPRVQIGRSQGVSSVWVGQRVRFLNWQKRWLTTIKRTVVVCDHHTLNLLLCGVTRWYHLSGLSDGHKQSIFVSLIEESYSVTQQKQSS